MKKLSLTASRDARTSAKTITPTTEVLELFFNTGVAYYEVAAVSELPDIVSSFVVMKSGATDAAPGAPPAPAAPPGATPFVSVRRAQPSEDPDVEVAILEHLADFTGRWIPVPYQLSCAFAVQVYIASAGGRRGAVRVLLAIDTLEHPGTRGRCLDAAADEGRPFRPLDRDELGGFLDHPTTRDFVRKLERAGIDAVPFKLAALYEVLGPHLPRLRFTKVENAAPIPVSLILDFGNSRTTAVLVEAREKGLLSIPLELRSSIDPFSVSEDAFDSRVTFLPNTFEDASHILGTGDGFALPTVTRLGREALDRALETPHRYACSMSSPKRYLWADEAFDEKWHFAAKQGGEYRPVSGRVLKYVVEDGGGLALRQDGPSAPPDPRYAPRTMMLFALTEILTQAYAQLASVSYRRFQGKENNPRVLKHVVLTFPSGMRDEEKAIYDKLAENAALLACYLLNIPETRRPNQGEGGGRQSPFLFVDEALGAQMVYLYQEVAETFAGSMEDFVKLYGAPDGKVRIASIDIGGGTTDVMVAEYKDQLPGAGTSLDVTKLFQDGVNVAGDEVCRAIVEDLVFPQILQQIDSRAGKTQLLHLFGEGDAGHGAQFRTLKAKLVPFFWLPLARTMWSIAEGFDIPGHTAEKMYSVDDVMRIFETLPFSASLLDEADRFLENKVEGFPGLRNLFLRFDRSEIERTIEGVLREPLRRYADILAQLEVDLLILAGRASALDCVRRLLVAELPLAPPRIVSMASYRVGDWYPSKWKTGGIIKDPKSTVTAGATVLHLASRNMLSGFMLDRVTEIEQRPIFGLYQDAEPHLLRESELFRKGNTSALVPYTTSMRIGFRNVDSPEMDATPLFEVRPRTPEVERVLVETRVALSFTRDKQGNLAIADVKALREDPSARLAIGPSDFVLKLKTLTTSRYWLDTGVFRNVSRYL